jgi:hypothetical protein
MDYNTQREKLTLPEYGRNIQKMVDFLKSITDKKLRSEQAEVVVNTMMQVLPEFKDNDENREKIWRHLYIMADFNLDIDCPYNITRENAENYIREKIPYNQLNRTLTSYGRLIQEMIDATIKDEESSIEEKLAVTKAIANQMKKIYVLWHKDLVSDTVILDDLKRLSNGKLSLPENTELVNIKDLIKDSQQAKKNKKKKKKKKKQKTT